MFYWIVVIFFLYTLKYVLYFNEFREFCISYSSFGNLKFNLYIKSGDLDIYVYVY